MHRKLSVGEEPLIWLGPVNVKHTTQHIHTKTIIKFSVAHRFILAYCLAYLCLSSFMQLKFIASKQQSICQLSKSSSAPNSTRDYNSYDGQQKAGSSLVLLKSIESHSSAYWSFRPLLYMMLLDKDPHDSRQDIIGAMPRVNYLMMSYYESTYNNINIFMLLIPQ